MAVQQRPKNTIVTWIHMMHEQYCCMLLCTHSGEQTEQKQLLNERISFHSFPDLQMGKERARYGWIKLGEILVKILSIKIPGYVQN